MKHKTEYIKPKTLKTIALHTTTILMFFMFITGFSSYIETQNAYDLLLAIGFLGTAAYVFIIN